MHPASHPYPLLTCKDSTESQSGCKWQPEADKPKQRTERTDSGPGNSEHLTQCTHLRSKHRKYVSLRTSEVQTPEICLPGQLCVPTLIGRFVRFNCRKS